MAGKLVEFAADGKMTKGYLAEAKDGKGPGIIVLQEWWGLVDHIKDVCDRFASAGFTALAPDLYHGETTKEPDAAGKLMMDLKMDQAEKDLKGSVNFLISQESCSSEKIGVIGFCMGGQLGLLAASRNSQISAVADFYGVHPNIKPDFSAIKAAVLGVFAENDEFVTPEVVNKLEADLKAAGKETDFEIFPGVTHAFFNDSRPDVYNKEAAEKAWNKTLAHFKRHIT